MSLVASRVYNASEEQRVPDVRGTMRVIRSLVINTGDFDRQLLRDVLNGREVPRAEVRVAILARMAQDETITGSGSKARRWWLRDL